MTDAERELITRAAMLERCLLLEDELAARRAVVAAANAPGIMSVPKPCPHCGQLMPASTPAKDELPINYQSTTNFPGIGSSPAGPPTYDASGDRGVVPTKDANVTGEDRPSGYMSKPKML